MTKRILLSFAALCLASAVSAQYAWQEGADPGKWQPGKDIHYKVEMQGSVSNDKTPLWLNAKKYGLSSLEENNG